MKFYYVADKVNLVIKMGKQRATFIGFSNSFNQTQCCCQIFHGFRYFSNVVRYLRVREMHSQSAR